MAERKCPSCTKTFLSYSGWLTHVSKYHPEVEVKRRNAKSSVESITIGELPRRPLKISISNGAKIARFTIYRFDLPEAVDLIAGVFRQELTKSKR